MAACAWASGAAGGPREVFFFFVSLISLAKPAVRLAGAGAKLPLAGVRPPGAAGALGSWKLEAVSRDPLP